MVRARGFLFALTSSIALVFLVYTLKLHLLLLSPNQIDFIHALLLKSQEQLRAIHGGPSQTVTEAAYSTPGPTDVDTVPQSFHNLVQGYRGQRQPYTRHIVAVGDLHGDLPNARKVLRFSDVVDDDWKWSGNVDFFVQTGDIIDRGDDTIPLFEWMDELREQAHFAGATVLSHLGNHEWMNMIGDWRYVYPTEIKTFGSTAARQRALSSGRIGRTWAANYTTTSRLPLHPAMGPPNTPYPPAHHSLSYEKDSDSEVDHLALFYNHDEDPLSHAAISFVHGGLSPTYEELVPFPTRINDISASLMRKLQRRKQPPPHPPNPYPGLPPTTTPEEERLYDSNGPLWYRGWAMKDESEVCSEVDEVLAKTGTRRMIMGHTPDFHNIVARCNGKIIIIDTGISHAYGGVLSALSIHYELHPVGEDTEHRWVEREVVSALYPDHRVVLAEDEREIVGHFRMAES